MTRGRCIPTDSMKNGDDYSNLDHNSEIGEYVELDKINPTYVWFMLCNAGLVIFESKEVGVKYGFILA